MPTLLMIDDDERLLESLKKWFQRYDLNLLTATYPQQGLVLLQQHPVDLIILDIMLPGMDGLEVCRTIGKQSEVPILMLSARGETLDRIVGLEVGADQREYAMAWNVSVTANSDKQSIQIALMNWEIWRTMLIAWRHKSNRC